VQISGRNLRQEGERIRLDVRHESALTINAVIGRAVKAALVGQGEDTASSGWAVSRNEYTLGLEGRCRHVLMNLDKQCSLERNGCFTFDVVSRVNAVGGSPPMWGCGLDQGTLPQPDVWHSSRCSYFQEQPQA
jgi:hypothetical protein